MKTTHTRKWMLGIIIVIVLSIIAITSALASDWGMVSDTINWQLDDSGIITFTGNGAMPDFTQGNTPWSQKKNQIVEVHFYGDITRIGDYAFSDCKKITYVAFPRTLKSIGKRAFYCCQVLASSNIATQSWSIPSYEWSADYKTLTASRVSFLDASVIQTETVNVLSSESIAEPTCLVSGTVKYTAGAFKNNAFTEQTITVEIPAKGHTEEADEAVAPTCTEPGKTAGIHCSVCGEVILEQETVPANGHSLSHFDKVEPTCIEKGNVEYWHCSVCEKYYTDEEGQYEIDAESCVLSKKNHTMTEYEAHTATCTEPGNVAHWYCSDCKRYYKDAEGIETINEGSWIIPAAHSMIYTEAKEPTCMAEGCSAYWYCSACHGYFSDEAGENQITEGSWVQSVNPEAHDWNETVYDWIDENRQVIATRTCKHNTEHLETETVTTTSEQTKMASCVEKGETTYTAAFTKSAFGTQTKTIANIEDLGGHLWGESEYEWSPENKCIARRICTRDRNHIETEEGTVTVQTTPATTEAAGKTVYTATFTNPAFTTQTKTVTIPKLEKPKPPVGPYTDKATGKYNIAADGTAAFVKPAAQKATITVPDSIKVNGIDVPVTAIADKAFSKDSKLTTINIGSNIKTIGKNAFSGCMKLKTVKGGGAVEVIKDSAFNGCVKLSKLPTFPKLVSIGGNAFKGCTALTKVTISASVNSIGKSAFGGCKKLKTITIKSTLLTKKNVKSGAFKGIPANATVKCPKSKVKDYQKFLPGKGVPKTAKIK